MIITIDGYCCQGKSFVGRELAKALGLEFLSTGNIVRYVAFVFTELQDGESDTTVLMEKAVKVMKSKSMNEIVNCEYLETEKTERALKIAAECPYVFEEVVKVIISYASSRNIVLDGRFTFDIFPHAYRNYYFQSSIERRASLAAKSENISYDEAVRYIAFRDSFEKKYDIPKYVRVIELDSFSSTDDLVQYLKNDVWSEG